MFPINRRRAIVAAKLLAGLALASIALGALAVSSSNNRPGSSASSSTKPRVFTNRDAAAWVAASGVTPRNLAAAGVDPAHAAAAIAAGISHAHTNALSLEAAVEAAQISRDARDESNALLVHGRIADEQARSDHAVKIQLAAAANGAVSNAIDAVFTAAAVQLTRDQAATLATIRANRHREVPVEYRTVERTDAQWLALRRALSNAKDSARLNHAPDPALAAIISQADQHPKVTSARESTTSNLDSIRTSWDSSAGE